MQISFTAHDQQLTLTAGETATVLLADGGHWYGHGFAQDQPWPLETGSIVNEEFAVNNIQCPIWMCSAGYALLAQTNDSLAVSINANDDGILRLTPSTDTELYIFHGKNLTNARQQLLEHLHAGRPQPAKDLLGDSIFCTWTQYPRCITQKRIIEMAQDIRKQGYPCSTLTIDDRWESCFGELSFGTDFPDPKGMLQELHDLGFKVLLWVTPFVNEEAATFDDLEAQSYLVPSKDGNGAARLRWWGGTAGLVDLTNPDARKWYRDRLLHLKNEIGIDGFKIDGGDGKYQPSSDVAAWHAPVGASGYVDLLLELFEEIAPGICETRTAWLSQGRNILWRLGGKDSHWGLDNGLKAVVTLSMHLALCGYDLIMPDMVPGRVQTMISDMPLPTDELMIRWTEVSAFMPLLQFSYYPWNYGDKTAAAVLGYANVHKALEDYLVGQVADLSTPVLRPLWYDHPERNEFYIIDDEFLLGPDILVCTVLDPERTSRTVVIPDDGWLDAWTGEPVSAGTHEYAAPCPGMPLFVQQQNVALAETLRDALSAIDRGSVPAGITTATYRAGLDRDLSVTG